MLKFEFVFSDMDDEQIIDIINAWNQTVEDRFTEHDTQPEGFETMMFMMSNLNRQFTKYLKEQNESLRNSLRECKKTVSEIVDGTRIMERGLV